MPISPKLSCHESTSVARARVSSVRGSNPRSIVCVAAPKASPHGGRGRAQRGSSDNPSFAARANRNNDAKVLQDRYFRTESAYLELYVEAGDRDLTRCGPLFDGCLF